VISGEAIGIRESEIVNRNLEFGNRQLEIGKRQPGFAKRLRRGMQAIVTSDQ